MINLSAIPNLRSSVSQRPSSRITQKPEIQLNQNFKSLTNIPQTTRVHEKQFQIRHSVNDSTPSSDPKRNNYRNIITDKRFSLVSAKKKEPLPTIIKIEELRQSSIDRNPPKSILKRKDSKSREHSDILDFFEMVDDHRLLPRRSEHTLLKPIKPVIQASASPSLHDTLSPKRVSFNSQVHVKLINEFGKVITTSKRYNLADLEDNN